MLITLMFIEVIALAVFLYAAKGAIKNPCAEKAKNGDKTDFLHLCLIMVISLAVMALGIFGIVLWVLLHIPHWISIVILIAAFTALLVLSSSPVQELNNLFSELEEDSTPINIE